MAAGAEAVGGPPATPPPIRRDAAQKLVGLLDFSSGAAGREGLDDILPVLLYSLMGEFAAVGGAILLSGAEGGLEVRAAKGRGARALLGLRYPVLGDDLPTTAIDGGGLAPDDPLSALAAHLPLGLLAPVRNRGRALGLLALGARLGGLPYEAAERELVQLVANVTGTVVANQMLYAELREANRTLRRRVFDLHVVFDTGVELERAERPEEIHRILAQTAMAHVFVTQCAVLLAEAGKLRVAFARGLGLVPDPARPDNDLSIDPEVDGGGFAAAVRARLGAESLVALRSGTATTGFLALGQRKDGRPLSQEDEEFLATLGTQALTALEKLRLQDDRVARERLQRELEIAQGIQRRLFPASLPRLEGYSLDARSVPCYEVGGDYYDALHTPAGLLVAVGDVSGKNVPAALLMAVLQATLRSVARRPGETPRSLLATLNRAIVESSEPSRFATFFLATLDPTSGRLRYGNAGHCPPMLVRKGGEIERLSTGGPLLGVFEDAAYEEGEIHLSSGDQLLVFSDGVSEAMNAAEEPYDEDRLAAVLRAVRGRPAAAILDAVLESVRAHVGSAPRSDDLTVLALAASPSGDGQ